jgi:hypothetical protein
MAGELPVIANEEILDQKDAIQLSGGGISVPYDVAKFAYTMIDLISSNNKREMLGTKGRVWVTINRNYSEMALEIERELRNLLR